MLGVSADAPHETIRRAYIALARRHHPDLRAGDGAAPEEARRMQAVNEAWSVLRDARRRREYDRSLGVPDSGDRSVSHGPAGSGDDDPAGWADDVGHQPLSPTRRRRALTVVPVMLFGAAVAAFCLGVLLGTLVLFAVAGVCVALSAALFVVAPLVAMTDARRGE